MYALNTFFRITRFVANSLVGLVAGFILGVFFASNDYTLSTWIASLGF